MLSCQKSKSGSWPLAPMAHSLASLLLVSLHGHLTSEEVQQCSSASWITSPTAEDASLECKVWPLGDPANGLSWPRTSPLPPPQDSSWGLHITSRQAGLSSPIFKSVLNFGLRWPPALLEPLFSAASTPESAYQPRPRSPSERTVTIFHSPVTLSHDSSLNNPFACQKQWP